MSTFVKYDSHVDPPVVTVRKKPWVSDPDRSWFDGIAVEQDDAGNPICAHGFYLGDCSEHAAAAQTEHYKLIDAQGVDSKGVKRLEGARG